MASLQCSLPLAGVYAKKEAVYSSSRVSMAKTHAYFLRPGGSKNAQDYQTETSDKVGRSLLKLMSRDAGKTNSKFWSGITFAGAASSGQHEQQISAEQKACSSCQILGEQERTTSNETTTGSSNSIRRDGPVFTPEKARILRQKLRLLESWHDTMYHSAIASRLAIQDK
ncbi:hypothetical protein O6H91_09G045300 [Diphasiastrum complanatum]|uniref:Uncharacterized protein n=1 Tax=Diphasiastrum complanatum TaxID=34168 RepID=A0ACC2CNW8_DIPCM|nr:hypothetical protein O6H91_09G045300 [Diphasiastrum complanatum]